jgi:quercetin dioxygenase-like cupin family protein
MLDLLRIDEALAGPPPEPANFAGRVRMQNLAAEGGAGGIELFAVHFDAGAHTRPHVHETDQVLHFVRGSGFVVFPGEERQIVPEHGIVVVPAGLVHMHGATEDGAVCHLAFRAAGPTDWAPAVPDEWRQSARLIADAPPAEPAARRRSVAQPRTAEGRIVMSITS